MKKVFRVFGGFLMFFGVCFALSGLVTLPEVLLEGNVQLLIYMLLFVVLGIGLFCLGYRLGWGGGDAVQKKQASFQPPPKKVHPPSLPKEKSEELQELLKKWREEMEQERLQRKMQREKLLEKWREIDPAEVEHIHQWEGALEEECAMSVHYVIGGCGDEGLDGTRDGTDVDWFYLRPGSNLEKAIELYAQINTYRKACEAHDIYAGRTENKVLYRMMNYYHDQRFLILSSEDQFTSLGENTQRCLELCREHDLHVVSGQPGHRFEDHVTGNIYEVYVGATFPGSADDAATYGELCLRVV